MDIMSQVILFIIVITVIYSFVFCIIIDSERPKKKPLSTPPPSRPSFLDAAMIPGVTNVDTTDIQQKKRIKKAFQDQAQQMESRALKPHAADCKDSFTCTKYPCFIVEGDKIVGKSVVQRKTPTQRTQEMVENDTKASGRMKRLKYGLEEESGREQ